MSGAKIRTIIVDDSVVVRGLLARILEREPDIEVAGTAANGQMALATLARTPADIVILDIEMPVMDGLTALPLILKENPGIKVLISSSMTERGAEITLKALSLGAADYLHKPSAEKTSRGLQQIGTELLLKIRALGRPAASEAPAVREPSPDERRLFPPRRKGGVPRVLAIGASTGGPVALTTLLQGLGTDFKLPILIVQHMPPIFTKLLAERLGQEARRAAMEAAEGMIIEPGKIYVAPGNFHMTVSTIQNAEVLRLSQDAPENHCRPAVDPLFRSVARAYGSQSIAVILTGMGEDGRRGSEELFEVGVKVLAQDQATSVVWGMPGAIVKAGLASAVLPLDRIAAAIRGELQGA